MRYLLLLFFSCTGLAGVDFIEIDPNAGVVSFSASLSGQLYGKLATAEAHETTNLAVGMHRDELRLMQGDNLQAFVCWDSERVQSYWLGRAKQAGLWHGDCIHVSQGAGAARLVLRLDCRGQTQKNASCFYWVNQSARLQNKVEIPDVLTYEILQGNPALVKIISIYSSDGRRLSQVDWQSLSAGFYFVRLQNGAVVPFVRKP